MRGRLINAFEVEVAQWDAQLSEQTQPGVDRTFREPRVGLDPVTHQRVLGRKERTVRLPAQVETGNYGQLVVLATGAAPKSALKLVFHYEDLEAAGMVDDQRRGTPVRVNDRLVAVYSLEDGALLLTFPNPPGLFVTEASPEGFAGGQLNLLVCSFGDRPQGKPGG